MKRLLIVLALLVIPSLSRDLFAFYDFTISNGTVTGDVSQIFFSASDITLSLTNIPGSGKRAIIGIIGGGGGSGGSNTTILVSSNGVLIADGSGGTNILYIDGSVVVTNGGFLINGTPVANGGSITISVSGGVGVTNVLDSAGGPFDLVGHTNQPTLLIKGLSNATPATLTITDFGTFIGFTVASQGGFGSTNTWTTNGLPWSVSDTFGFSNASSVVGLAFTNLGGVPTIYLVPDSALARTGQSQTWSAPQTFNSSATLTLGAPTWFKSSVTVSDNVTIVSNATVGGSATITGSVTSSGTGSFAHFGAGQIDNGTIGSNTFPVTGITANIYGDASHPVIIGVGSDGRIYSIQQVAIGSVLGSSTNSIAGVFADGVSNNPVTFLSFQNFPVHTLNGTTSTVGFANLPFDSITVINGTTNFTLHGSSLTISNLLSNYGITLTNRGNGQIDLGGTVTMLSNGAGAFVSLGGNSSGNTTQNWSGTSQVVIAIPNNGGPVKIVPNGGGFNGIQSELQQVPQDGGSQAYINLTRNGNKAGAMFINFNDANSGNVLIGQLPPGNAAGDKRNVNISTTTAVGGLLVVNQDGNNQAGMNYQFYENDPRFPRIVFTDNKAQGNTNTPNLHETYASYGNWTNFGGGSALVGGSLIVIGSNENWLVACGRALGSVNGNKSNEYPTNRVSGFLAAGLNTAQSNQTFVVVRDQTNGVWCIGVDTNGVLGAYRTNDLSTTVFTY